MLPERVFHNPVAARIIEPRKELTLHPEDRGAVAETLSDLSLRPGFFGDDMVVFMALRTAQARLVLEPRAGRDPGGAAAAVGHGAAHRGRPRAASQRDLRQAMQALQDALARNAPDAEIERLMRELQQAIDRYLQALAQQMQRQNAEQQMSADRSRRTC